MGRPFISVAAIALGLGMLCYYRYKEDSSRFRDSPTVPISPEIQTMMDLTHSENSKMEFAMESGEFRTEDYSHILVLPDVHGDSENMIQALWAGVLSTDVDVNVSFQVFRNFLLDGARLGSYPPGPLFPMTRVVIVSMGDVVDRGPESVLCLRVLWSIEKVIGWKLVSLYGNHESLAYLGDMKYVHQTEIRDFGSERNRRAAFGYKSALWLRFAMSSVLVARFSDSFKKGVVFSHAGVESSWINWVEDSHLGKTVTDWNMQARVTAHTEINVTDGLRDTQFAHMFLYPDTPVWTRIFGGEEKRDVDVCGVELGRVLNYLHTDRLIVGHTVQGSKGLKMNHDCGNRLIRTDVALSRDLITEKVNNMRYPGNPSVLVMKVSEGYQDFDSITAVYYNVKEGKVYSEDLLHTKAA